MSFKWPWPEKADAKYSKLGEDEASDVEDKPRLNRFRQFLLTHSIEIIIALFLMNVATLIVLLFTGGLSTRPSSVPQKVLDSPLPTFPTEIRQFQEDRLYMSRPSAESDAAWEALSGPDRPHRGFVRLDTGSAPDYGGNTEEKMYGISVFHQLHCLGGVRKMLWDIIYGRADVEHLLAAYPENATEFNFEATTHGLWHVNHCLDYVRQALQCNADLSLEWPVEVNGETLVVGWDNVHECKNWDSIYAFAEQHS
ncbi:putative Tat pathway signal sequence [Seiridium unicorne]|uniref:Tat pathway signal sequence n=1 Tax=Seiridium unicorne TaxID=138068 RepID=A0ABR2VEI7_9PEZI